MNFNFKYASLSEQVVRLKYHGNARNITYTSTIDSRLFKSGNDDEKTN